MNDSMGMKIRTETTRRLNPNFSRMLTGLVILIFISIFPLQVCAGDDNPENNITAPGVVSSYVHVANYSLDPAILMPWDQATVTFELENAQKIYPVDINSASVATKDLKVITDTYYKVGTIGPQNRLPLTFTIEAYGKPGVYYPLFSATFRSTNYYLRYPFPVIVQNNPVVLSVFETPDTWEDGKKGKAVLELSNTRTNAVTSAMVTPDAGSHEIMPSSFFIGNLNGGESIHIPFNITPHGQDEINFTVKYLNGINPHSSSCFLKIAPGTSKKQADLFISNIELIPGGEYLTIKGDATNQGLDNAYGVIITSKEPAEPVFPYKQYGVGQLKTSEFNNFQVTMKPPEGAQSVTLITSFKDNEGNVISTETPINISAITAISDPSQSPITKAQTGFTGGLIPDELELPLAGLVIIIIIGLFFTIKRRKVQSEKIHNIPSKGEPENNNHSKPVLTLTNDNFQEAMTAYKKGNYKAAAEQFYQVVQEDKSDHRAWNAYGICLTKLGLFDEAAGCYDNASRLQPDNASYMKNRALNEKKREPGNG